MSLIVLFLDTRYDVCECNSLWDMTTNVFVYINCKTQKVGHEFLYIKVWPKKWDTKYDPGSKYRSMPRVKYHHTKFEVDRFDSKTLKFVWEGLWRNGDNIILKLSLKRVNSVTYLIKPIGFWSDTGIKEDHLERKTVILVVPRVVFISRYHFILQENKLIFQY